MNFKAIRNIVERKVSVERNELSSEKMAEGSMGKEEINDVIMHDSENHASLPSVKEDGGSSLMQRLRIPLVTDECAVLLGGGRSSKDESVQAPEELERIHSIGEKAYPAEGPSFTQMSIPVVIPTVNALITHKALQCNNCNERIARLVAKQTFCYPDWCEQCDESLWSTREMHS